jgi:hypothetical protein
MHFKVKLQQAIPSFKKTIPIQNLLFQIATFMKQLNFLRSRFSRSFRVDISNGLLPANKNNFYSPQIRNINPSSETTTPWQKQSTLASAGFDDPSHRPA